MPLTANPVNVPTEVILGCAALVTEYAKFERYAGCSELPACVKI